MISFTDFFFFRVLSILRLIDIVTLFFFCSYFSPVPPHAHIAAKVERERSPPSRHTLTEIHSLIQWTHTQVLCWSVGVLVCWCVCVCWLHFWVEHREIERAVFVCAREVACPFVVHPSLLFIFYFLLHLSIYIIAGWTFRRFLSLSLSLLSG